MIGRGFEVEKPESGKEHGNKLLRLDVYRKN
jgi:hypothetical protein